MKPANSHSVRIPLFFIALFAAAVFFVTAAASAALAEDGGADEIENGDKMMWAAAKSNGYLRFKVMTPVSTEFFADKDRMKEVMRAFFRKEYPEDKFQAMNALMLKFGFSTFEDKTEDEIVEDYTKGVLGVYDEEIKKIYVVSSGLYEQLKQERYDECNIDVVYGDPVWDDWYHKHLEDMVLVHESTHALQDENFDLYDKREKFKHNDDAQLAISAMAEGEAELAEEKFTYEALKTINYTSMFYEYGTSWDMRLFAALDDYIEARSKEQDNSCSEDMSFLGWMTLVPYTFGKIFMYKQEQENGRDSVNNSFVKCPLSSEQVMNSDKYFNAKLEDLPTFINMPSYDDLIDVETMRYLDYNSMGQLKLYLLCRDLYFDAQTTCYDMADGWDGDRYIVWRDPDDNILLAWYTSWDSRNDAQEFSRFYKEAWDRKEISSSTAKSGEGWSMSLSDEESMYIESKDNDVVIIMGLLDEDGFKNFAERLWTSEKYEADYSICVKSRDEFVDNYPGYTRENKEQKESSAEEE